jgi:ornithine cyclodeaminase/alanine dehydrogenase-like protein (mu-crystallin family)
MGIQDIYAAAKAIEIAKSRGIGTQLPV